VSNRFGQAYGLTTISPIINGRTDGVHSAQQLRATLAELPRGRQSPFARVAGTHTARWFVVDDLVSEPYPAGEDHLNSKYLVFIADFDGPLEQYVSSLVASIPDVIDSVWSHCVGYPGSSRPRAVLDYIRDCQVNTTLYFGGYPGATVEAALRALLVQRSMIEFVEQSRNLPSGELQAAFRRFRARMEKAPTPAPASM
jgi:hypothetical protein